MDRQPCPHRIYDDIGGAFAMGCVGGGIFHIVKGSLDAPKGEKIKGSINAVKVRAPILGGNFAVWGGLFSTFDCLILKLRNGKEDPWNSVSAGALTGAVLAIRGGPKAMARSGFVGGVFIGVIELASLTVQKYMTSKQLNQNKPPSPPSGQPSMDPEYRRREFDFIPPFLN